MTKDTHTRTKINFSASLSIFRLHLGLLAIIYFVFNSLRKRTKQMNRETEEVEEVENERLMAQECVELKEAKRGKRERQTERAIEKSKHSQNGRMAKLLLLFFCRLQNSSRKRQTKYIRIF